MSLLGDPVYKYYSRHAAGTRAALVGAVWAGTVFLLGFAMIYGCSLIVVPIGHWLLTDPNAGWEVLVICFLAIVALGAIIGWSCFTP